MLGRAQTSLCVGALTLLIAASVAAAPTASTAVAATPAATGTPPAPVPATDEADPKHHVALTLGTLYLLLPVVRVAAEVAIVPRVSLALTAGVGQLTIVTDEDDGERKRRIDTWQAGGQANVYLLGDFEHGMQLGAEVLYAHLALPSGQGASGQLDGWAVGPYLGYKFSAPFGLTFNAQLGIEVGTAKVEGESDGERLTKQQLIPLPILNLNLGWAF